MGDGDLHDPALDYFHSLPVTSHPILPCDAPFICYKYLNPMQHLPKLDSGLCLLMFEILTQMLSLHSALSKSFQLEELTLLCVRSPRLAPVPLHNYEDLDTRNSTFYFYLSNVSLSKSEMNEPQLI